MIGAAVLCSSNVAVASDVLPGKALALMIREVVVAPMSKPLMLRYFLR